MASNKHHLLFLNYVHFFRGIAILFIVSGHCIRFFSWETNSQTEKISKAIMMNGTVFFVFIAGFLFQHLSDKYSYGKYLKNKFKYVIIPYFFVSIPMVLYHVFIQKQGHWSFPGLEKQPQTTQIAWFYLTGQHLAPLWFIPMITVFYVLYPIFIKIDHNKFSYFILLPFTAFISILVHRSPGETKLFHVSAHFLSVYIFGMFCSRYKENLFPFIEKNILILSLILLGTILIECLYYENAGLIYVKNIFNHKKELVNINYFQKILLSLILLYFFKKYESPLISTEFSKVLRKFAEFSFGIYFVHYYFIEAMLKIRGAYQYTVDGNLFRLIIMITSILLISFLSIMTVKYLFKEKSRYLVGC